ncbi:c-type cytochrome [Rhodanobacter sp. DHG33]|uniref:c-type cytochrome n=1 Tax=Rhodanobacter sp. DHG33 TaxID=2775921 RepID=UPI00177DC814|nr:c-type cytochrome [Rhodanobacter sp. DHG33]MBD8899447.1 cytochrome c4 [Rhodanobacter sp. DHG33]
MGFRFAGFRPAALGSAAALLFALTAGAAMAQSAPAKAATTAHPAAAASAAPAPAAAAATAETATKPGDATAGQGKAAACGACHGMDGNSTDPQYPKLAGQSEQYIAHQLENFKSGKRQNPIMLGMATPLSEQDMHDIGAYFASKTALPGVADQALVEHGQQLFREGDVKRGIPACMACHSIDGRGNPGAEFPQLASQHAQYIESVLKAWHDGGAWGTDAHSQIMPGIAQKLDAGDITAVASYIEGLHPATAGDLPQPSATP